MSARKPSLTLRRQIKAPVERVYNAWTSGEALKRWFCPSRDMMVAQADVDLRVGGRYRIVMQEAGAAQHKVGGVYREIVPNAKLVFTWAWESTPERESMVTIQFEAAGDGTQLTLIHEQFADEPARDRHSQGWNGCLDQLTRHVEA